MQLISYNPHQTPIKISAEISLISHLCVPSFGMSEDVFCILWLIFQSVQNDEEKLAEF